MNNKNNQTDKISKNNKINIPNKLYNKLKKGYLWIFNNEINTFIDSETQFVDFYYNNRFFCKAYYNPRSKIAYRVISYQDEEIDYNFWYRRLQDLYFYKSSFYKDNFRWVYSEGDFIPGLIIDLYTTIQGQRVAVVMFLTKGTELQKHNIFQALKKMKIDCIIDRSDNNLRELEGLELRRKVEYGDIEIPFTVKIDDILFLIDPLNGQKTGFYFDQTENRRFLKNIAKDKVVLDVFCYIGSFSLYALKYGAKFAELIDESNFSYNILPKIMEINGFKNKYLFHKDNAFNKLRELNDLKKEFSIVILDPPSFVKTKDKIKNALKAYYDINSIALKLLQKGGYLLTSSCSQKVKEEQLLEVIFQAFSNQNRIGKLIYRGQQAFDHPINLAMPETQYLKFFAFQVF